MKSIHPTLAEILALMELNRNSPANRRKWYQITFSLNETKRIVVWTTFLFYWKLHFKVHILFCMEKQCISRGIVWSISVTNLQFTMTSLEHKTLPLVNHKNTLGYTYESTEFKQAIFSLSPWEFIKKNSQSRVV